MKHRDKALVRMYLRGIVTIVVVLVLLLILKHRGIIIQEQDAPAGVVMEEVENGA